MTRWIVLVALAVGCRDRSPPRETPTAAPEVAAPEVAAPVAHVDANARALLPPENLDDWAIDSREPPVVDGSEPLPKTDDELDTWNGDAKIAALQGAWVVPMLSTYRMVALDIHGISVRVYDGKGEHEVGLRMLGHGPCQILIGGNFYSFTRVGGRAVFGLGTMGTRRGADAVVCSSDGTYVLNHGRCRLHDPDLDRWTPTRCGLDDNEFTYLQDSGVMRSIATDGDAIIGSEARRDRARPVADFATAKAIVQAYVDARDLAHIAALAGGRVGSTDTVANAAATIAADARGWRGRAVTIHGVVRSQSWVTANGFASHAITLTDASDGSAHTGELPTAPHVDCFAADDVSASEGDRVVAAGTVSEPISVGAIALHDCVLSR